MQQPQRSAFRRTGTFGGTKANNSLSSAGTTLPLKTHQPPASTRISSHNGVLLTSTGIASLDSVFGGGIPCGSLTLVQEDVCNYASGGCDGGVGGSGSGGYARLMLRYFLAQGVAAGHSICITSCAADEHPQMILKQLMAPVGNEEDSASSADGVEDVNDEEDEGGAGGGVGVGVGQTRMLGTLRSFSSNTVGGGGVSGGAGEKDRMTIAWRYQNQAKFGVSTNKSAVIRGWWITKMLL